MLADCCANKSPIGLQWTPVEPYRKRWERVKPSTIGRFGLPSDSSASAHTSNPEDPLSAACSDSRSVYMSPSDMFEDSPIHVDRILAIKATVDDMRNQNEATHRLLQDVLDKLSPAQARNVPDPIRPPTCSSARSSPIPTSSAGRRKNFFKPSAPSEFNRDWSAGKAFLTSCRTYIRLCPESFKDDLTKVVWAMSYMKAGRAGHWANREFEHEAKSGQLRFINWVDFEEEFRKDFMPLDSKAAAINVLETTSYFQGRRSVDDYLDQFKNLIEDSNYSDPKTIVVKFRRGLDGPCGNDLRETRRHGSRSLVPPCHPDGPEPRRG